MITFAVTPPSIGFKSHIEVRVHSKTKESATASRPERVCYGLSEGTQDVHPTVSTMCASTHPKMGLNGVRSLRVGRPPGSVRARRTSIQRDFSRVFLLPRVEPITLACSSADIVLHSPLKQSCPSRTRPRKVN